ncbi:MAG: 16S rRNA (adenine(1518)-N(6)/adenine(1519)-N(6))-dimethyltransferase RsmA [Patescibacteria group bacterium]
MLKKSYGQHFLRDESVVERIIEAAAIQPGELVIEVGPGGGALTKRLAEIGNDLILIEADRDLIEGLRETYPRATVVHADAAQVDFDVLTQGRRWVFVSNLPYNAGNAILEAVFRAKNVPNRLVVMVQKEVGERMMAAPGEMSVLSVATQIFCAVKRVCTVKPDAFVPPPKVDSVVLEMIPHAEISGNAEQIIGLAKIGFAHRRKQLRQTLAQGGVADLVAIDRALEAMSLPKTVRPQELSIENWITLWSTLAHN